MVLSDNRIIEGFQAYNTKITKEYFYGYCRRAYLVLDNKYQLKNKVGLDFYSLAHEYYLQLMTHDFKPLMDRPENIKLSSFMFKGFWFVTMDALKAHKKEFESSSDADIIMQYVCSEEREEGMMEQIALAVSHYYKDRTMANIAWGLFVLGFKQKEVSEEVGLTPSAVNQRYKKMMEEVVTPFIIENYGKGIYYGAMTADNATMPMDASVASSVREPEMCCKSATSFVDVEGMLASEEGILSKLKRGFQQRRITPEYISSLKKNEIFVFGSNLCGIHAAGASNMAYLHFGAEMGKGVGLQGQSYAIPTMQGGVETIKPYVDEFIEYASQHKELHFLVTQIGCGIAGFEPKDIAPLFESAKNMKNVSLPESFLDILQDD